MKCLSTTREWLLALKQITNVIHASDAHSLHIKRAYLVWGYAFIQMEEKENENFFSSPVLMPDQQFRCSDLQFSNVT